MSVHADYTIVNENVNGNDEVVKKNDDFVLLLLFGTFGCEAELLIGCNLGYVHLLPFVGCAALNPICLYASSGLLSILSYFLRNPGSLTGFS